MLVERLGVSERRACQITGQHRSTQRHQPRRGGERDDALRARLRSSRAEHPRWGYRLAWGCRARGGLGGEPQEDPAAVARGGPAGAATQAQAATARHSTSPASGCGRERPNHVWALDFQFDTTVDGRTLKLLHVVDEHTREALAIAVAALDRRRPHRPGARPDRPRARTAGHELVRMDNGPEMTANALRDWCRFGGSGRSFIEPGSPWQNPFVESFGSRVRDEVLSVEAFDSLLEAQDGH